MTSVEVGKAALAQRVQAYSPNAKVMLVTAAEPLCAIMSALAPVRSAVRLAGAAVVSQQPTFVHPHPDNSQLQQTYTSSPDTLLEGPMPSAQTDLGPTTKLQHCSIAAKQPFSTVLPFGLTLADYQVNLWMQRAASHR